MKKYFFDYYFVSNSYPKYLAPVVELMERFKYTLVCRPGDLNIIQMELREELERCKERNPKSEATLDAYFDAIQGGGQFYLRPKKLTEDSVCRLGFKVVRKQLTYDANINRWKEVK